MVDRTKIKAKLRDRGKKCLPKTRSIILSRGVIFLNQKKETNNETRISEPKQGSQESKQASQTKEGAPTMTWSLIDRGVKCFITTKKYGPGRGHNHSQSHT